LHEKAETTKGIGRYGCCGASLSAEAKNEARAEATTDAAQIGGA
jgi:hypothetical protein